MQKLSKFIIFLFFLIVILITFFFSLLNTRESLAQSPIRCGLLDEACCNLAGSAPNSCQTGLKCESNKCISDGSTGTPPTRGGVTGAAFPEIGYPCDKVKGSEDFHSLRPYQAAACGDAGKARYCSNDLVFVESFDVTGRTGGGVNCTAQGREGTFTCNPDLTVDEHDLIVDLDNSMFPIMGNTEEVKNSQNSGDTFDDATKVNEYASWYLSGVNNRAEYGENTDEKVVNFSGPVQKLLPKMIQEAERIETIKKATETKTVYDEELGKDVNQPENHDQVVVCGEKDGFFSFLGIGITKPKPCYEAEEYRLSKWLGDLSDFNGFFNRIGTDIWNKRTPPLPWADENGIPFESQQAYQKAYNEWRGESCVLVPFIDVNLCIDNPFVPNKWAELYQYIPLSNTTDKKGAQLLAPEHPIYRAAPGTAIDPDSTSNGKIKNAVLYFAHTQEVKELSELLNKTYTPLDCPEGKDCKLLENNRGSVETNYCSVANVRVNKGDDLFPGQIEVPEVTYKITEAECKETYKEIMENNHAPTWACGINGPPTCPGKQSSIKCTAQVYITLHTQTKTPNADEIFDETVAGTGSTFRKIFPKVEEGAPVSCIADMPTVTDVTYEATNTLQGGDSEFQVKRFPEDGAGSNPQLTFPHVGSVYEYFLKGIQTALRPKGYGEPIVSGTLCSNIACGELPVLPKGSGACALGNISSRVGDIPQSLKDIVEAAGKTYKVPPNLLLGIMFGESAFEGLFDWTEENVKSWASCTPFPGCDPSADVTKNVVWFATDEWKGVISDGIREDLKKLDPNKQDPDGCNLLDAVYGLAWLSRDNVDGGAFAVPQCFGIPLNTNGATTKECVWKDNDYETVIKMWESGTSNECFTKDNSCATGGGHDAACPTGGDTCETIGTRYTNPSHNACVFDVAHGN